jgi:DNA-directed RNA polymerase specialized sigma24 family protein
MKPKEKPHYVNNAEFSAAIVEYVARCNVEVENGNAKPQVTDYIAQCFLKISEGLSHKANFVRYTYREEMVMDAVENCLKAVDNYNLETATRTGKPNAFAYFTQIAWYAFLRRIQKEKKQQDIKLKYLTESDISLLLADEMQNDESLQATQSFVDSLKERIEMVKETDKAVKEYGKEVRKKRRRRVDSDLSDFLEDDEQ